jgi:dipeptidyl-peptidase 4
MEAPSMREGSFPRRFAATRRFTLGRPRSFVVASDGSRVAFLRSRAGDDPVNDLYELDVATGTERPVAEARALLGHGGDEDLPAAERARRERMREAAGGIVAYASDPTLSIAAFAFGGRLFLADPVAGSARETGARGPVFDPRPDPTGRRVAYLADRSLRVIDAAKCGSGDVDGDREVAADEDENVSWGAAEFVAAEEMGRHRGFWWSPDGQSLLAARVDISGGMRWHVADPSEPAAPPRTLAYPAAGTPNADVALAVFGIEDGSRTDVEWDREAFPYLVEVHWSKAGPPLLLVQSRDQRTMRILAFDPGSRRTRTVREDHDAAWLEITPGVPAWTDAGALVWTANVNGTHRLLVDGEPVTPAALQVRAVLDVGDGVLFAASDDPTEQHVWLADASGKVERLTTTPGVHTGVRGGGVTVITSATLDPSGTFTIVLRSEGDRREPLQIASFAERPSILPKPVFDALGERELRTALLLPSEGVFERPLPVLMDPYGGPGHARVVAAPDGFLQSQWFADQGFAVIVADGRGTPGRGPAWERAVHLDLATFALEDQVDALHAVSEANPGLLDTTRVAIRGWSFGGYLAALAVLRRPDVFAAAVAGAPVADWTLYDTHYTERYLGTPQEQPEAYRRSSLLEDAVRLERPLMLIHGMADDNVVAAHTLRLSGALLAAGRPHTVLPLSGVTHMTPQEVVAENLLLLQVEFLRDALASPAEAQR